MHSFLVSLDIDRHLPERIAGATQIIERTYYLNGLLTPDGIAQDHVPEYKGMLLAFPCQVQELEVMFQHK